MNVNNENKAFSIFSCCSLDACNLRNIFKQLCCLVFMRHSDCLPPFPPSLFSKSFLRSHKLANRLLNNKLFSLLSVSFKFIVLYPNFLLNWHVSTGKRQ